MICLKTEGGSRQTVQLMFSYSTEIYIPIHATSCWISDSTHFSHCNNRRMDFSLARCTMNPISAKWMTILFLETLLFFKTDEREAQGLFAEATHWVLYST